MNPKIFSVTEINNYIKNIFQRDMHLSGLFIKGEISNFKLHSSGHVYFTLKDADSRIKCVMFKSSFLKVKFMPEDGLAVIVSGYMSIYERDGQYQMYADSMLPEGTGSLYKAYEQLKSKLSKQGLFDETTKKKLPYMPKTVGVITSPTGAAVRDIISIIKRRWPMADILLFPVQVQGEKAASEIVMAIKYFNKEKNADVLIVGRGGGSIEELWAFNEEKVAYAIFESDIPIVSAVGHETDFTIADFVSDVRAATPSAAAELVVPDKNAIIDTISQLNYKINKTTINIINNKKMLLKNRSAENTIRYVERKLMNLNQTLEQYDKEIKQKTFEKLSQSKDSIANLKEKLNILNPEAALRRGYSYTTDLESNLITSIKQTVNDQTIRIVLADGVLTAEIKNIGGRDL